MRHFTDVSAKFHIRMIIPFKAKKVQRKILLKLIMLVINKTKFSRKDRKHETHFAKKNSSQYLFAKMNPREKTPH